MKLPKDVITGDSDMDDEMIYDIQDGVTEIN